MSQYNKILEQFKSLGYSETSSLQQYQINKALDKISSTNGGAPQFDRDVSAELWEHTQKDRGGNAVLLRDYVQSIIEAQNVLKQHITATQEKLKYQNNPDDKQQLQADLVSYVQDHKILTQPFNIPHIAESRAISQSRAQMAASNRFSQGGQSGRFGHASQIFATAPSSRQQSWSLKIVLILTAILLGIQLIVMFNKHHFFNLLVYTLIFLIFAQNFFDKTYMKAVLISSAVSILLDFIWLIVHSTNFWNPYAQTQHSTLQNGFLKFTYFMVICTMIAKILIVILLFRYRDNDQNIRKSVTLFSLSFKLDGKSQHNPLTAFLTGKAKDVHQGNQYNFA